MQLLYFVFQGGNLRALLFYSYWMSWLFVKYFILVSFKLDDFLIDLFGQILNSVEKLILLLYRHFLYFARIDYSVNDLIKRHFRICLIILNFFSMELFFCFHFFRVFLCFDFLCFLYKFLWKLDLVICYERLKVVYCNCIIFNQLRLWVHKSIEFLRGDYEFFWLKLDVLSHFMQKHVVESLVFLY